MIKKFVIILMIQILILIILISMGNNSPNSVSNNDVINKHPGKDLELMDIMDKRMRSLDFPIDIKVDLIVSGYQTETVKIISWIKQNINFTRSITGAIIILIHTSESMDSMSINNQLSSELGQYKIKNLNIKIKPLSEQWNNHDCGSYMLIYDAFKLAESEWFLYAENDMIIFEQNKAFKYLSQYINNHLNCYIIGAYNHPNMPIDERYKYHINGKALYNKAGIKFFEQIKPLSPSECAAYDFKLYDFISTRKHIWSKYCRSNLFMNTHSDPSLLTINDINSLFIL
jgi:hypothetical protein